MNSPRDTTITCSKEARVRTRAIAAHLDIPMWQVLDAAIAEMLKKHNLPEPLALQKEKVE